VPVLPDGFHLGLVRTNQDHGRVKGGSIVMSAPSETTITDDCFHFVFPFHVVSEVTQPGIQVHVKEQAPDNYARLLVLHDFLNSVCIGTSLIGPISIRFLGCKLPTRAQPLGRNLERAVVTVAFSRLRSSYFGFLSL
jgi:hypothetical protein